MSESHTQKEWRTWCTKGLGAIRPILDDLGYTLDREQQHIGGERFLMQAVTTTSGKKLILTGKRARDNARVIIKATDDPAGKREIEHERNSRQTLHTIKFAYETFFSPEEYLFTRRGDFLIAIYEFIEQERPFLERPIQEQFSFALAAFKAQESAHATTYTHLRRIERTFESRNADDYLEQFFCFRQEITTALPDATDLAGILAESKKRLEAGKKTIEQYCCFLTHTDFVPHNIRICNGKIYLLDHSSLRFGNKYEGWARFVNFMELHNPELARALEQYVHDNRTPEEGQALRLMRIYRLGEIIWYYTQTLEKTSGDLLILNKKRIGLWCAVLTAVLDGTTVSSEILTAYKKERDALRSAEEKRRQIGLH